MFRGALAVAQNYTVPSGIQSLVVKLWGAAGGSGFTGSRRARGGSGAFVRATLAVTPGETLTVVVGQGGATFGSGAAFGNGGSSSHDGLSCSTPHIDTYVYGCGGGGGGLAGIFSSGSWSQSNALVVAGAGGGSSRAWYGNGGGGGYPAGSDGSSQGSADGSSAMGLGGSQTAGGAGGTGGAARTGNGTAGSALTGGAGLRPTGGGGGAGYYGGGGGDGLYGGGGGGSSWTHPTRCSSVAHVAGELGSGVASTANTPTHPAATDPDYEAGVAVSWHGSQHWPSLCRFGWLLLRLPARPLCRCCWLRFVGGCLLLLLSGWWLLTPSCTRAHDSRAMPTLHASGAGGIRHAVRDGLGRAQWRRLDCDRDRAGSAHASADASTIAANAATAVAATTASASSFHASCPTMHGSCATLPPTTVSTVAAAANLTATAARLPPLGTTANAAFRSVVPFTRHARRQRDDSAGRRR
jgi:hypothetical protein